MLDNEYDVLLIVNSEQPAVNNQPAKNVRYRTETAILYGNGNSQMKGKTVDRRIPRTRQSLQDALITLILKKGYDKITVQNIIDEANVGRSTFYAHYLDKDDLMAKSVEKLREELHQHMVGANSGDAQDAVIGSLTLFRHTKGQHHLYKAMIGGRGIDIVTRALHDSLTSYARAYFEQIERKSGPLPVPVPVMTVYLAGTLQTLLTWWLDNDMPYSPEQMNEMFVQLVLGGITAVIPYSGGPPES